MLLSTNRKPLASAIAFLIGSGAALVAIGIFSLALSGGTGAEDANRPSDIKSTIDTIFGSFFLILAFKLWLKVPDPNASPPELGSRDRLYRDGQGIPVRDDNDGYELQ